MRMENLFTYTPRLGLTPALLSTLPFLFLTSVCAPPGALLSLTRRLYITVWVGCGCLRTSFCGMVIPNRPHYNYATTFARIFPRKFSSVSKLVILPRDQETAVLCLLGGCAIWVFLSAIRATPWGTSSKHLGMRNVVGWWTCDTHLDWCFSVFYVKAKFAKVLWQLRSSCPATP